MRKALVTGGADGIGLEIVKELVKLGFQVIVFDKKQMKENIENVFYHEVDINDMKIVDSCLTNYSSLDLLVNNAAIQYVKPFADNSDLELEEVINTNLLSLMKITRRCLKLLINGSQIINISSVHSVLPRKNKLSYDVSKAGLDMFTKSLALQLAPHVRVNSVNIGATFSPMNSVFENEELREESKNKVPMNHIFEANEIAKVVVSLLGETYRNMTGSIIVYDGGRSLN
jgi:NAD(P)-dependent dehydrogenase (short-subunit alcohol dehydrogenase family)